MEILALSSKDNITSILQAALSCKIYKIMIFKF